MIKICNRCGIDISNTHHNANFCSECVKLNKKERCKRLREANAFRNKNRDYSLDVGIKLCSTCGKYKEFNKCYKENDGYKSQCRECQQISTPKERQRRSERAKTKECRDIKRLNAKRRNENPEYRKLQSIKRKERNIKRKERFERLGVYDPQIIINRVRKQLRRAFNNYSRFGKVSSSTKYGIDFYNIISLLGPPKHNLLEIDHIIPCVVFNFDNHHHVFLCNLSDNLRWLDASENSRKQDKIIWSLIEGNCMLEAICLELGITKEDDGKDGREIRERLYPNN